MENKRILTYVAAIWMAFTFVGVEAVVEASQISEPVVQQTEECENDPSNIIADITVQETEETVNMSTIQETDNSSNDTNSEHNPPSERPKSNSEIKDTTETAPQIVEHPAVLPYVLTGSDYQTPVYNCTAKLPDSATQDSITFTWYVDGNIVTSHVKTASQGEEITDTYTAEDLNNLTEYGVHPVYCVVSMDAKTADADGNIAVSTLSNQSMSVNFIVCNGVNNQELLVFSDVHETFSNIGKAINNMMNLDNEGLIPGLIVCTGDWGNNHWMSGDVGSENYSKTRDILISRLEAQSGGIDTVFVSGNHENGAAARDENIKNNLGVESDYDGAGVIFDGRVLNSEQNKGSSAGMENLIVYGINYENLLTDTGYSYENILPKLEQFLEELRSSYGGELVVVAAHAGLHVLDNWSGKEQYNIDRSNEMAALLNKYSDLGVNITFLFGHDHSKRESEMLLRRGDQITSTVSYAMKDIDEAAAKQTQTLSFTYGHAGYITNNIGGKQRYTVIEWTDLKESNATVKRTLYELGTENQTAASQVLYVDTNIVTSYHFLNEEQTYSRHKGETSGMELKADADMVDVLTGVMVDGQKIDTNHYKVNTDGITLTADFLRTLKAGQHTVKLLLSNDTGLFSDVEMRFTIIDEQIAINSSVKNLNSNVSTPKTGVENDILLWTAAQFISAFGIVSMYRKRKGSQSF